MAGGSDSAQREAQAQQRQQDARNAATVAQVRGVFNSPQRSADIAQLVKNMRDYYDQDLDRQKAINDRQLTFALARNGQTGGSTQVDQSAQLNRDYTKGLLQAQQKASAAGAALQAADQQAEAGLIAQAQAGVDPITASTQAAAAMRTNLQAQQAQAQTQGLGNVFGDLATVYDNSRTAAGEREADKKFNDLYNNLMGTPAVALGSTGH